MATFQGTQERRAFSRTTFGSTVGDTVEIGTWTVDNGAHSMRVSVTASISGFSVAKNFEVAAQFDQTGNTFRKVYPIASPGNYSGNDFNLEARADGKVLTLRLIKTQGTTSGTYYINTEYNGYGLPGYSFTESTSTGSGATPDTLALSGIGLETYAQGRSVFAGGDYTLPCFQAHMSTAAAYGTNNYVIPCNIADSNPGGYYNTSTYEFTAPGPGVYAFFMAVSIDNNGGSVADDSGALGFSINGANQGAGSLGTLGLDLMYNPRTLMGGLGSGVEHGYTHSNVLTLASGDAVTARLLDYTNTSGGAPSICRGHFSGFKVG
tara:strand:+ start:435 stop:1397 length:963 start_codon:yes stop_codon:yes gene_type:complete